VKSHYKLILLDRDGVINQKPKEGSYVTKEIELLIFGEVIEVVSKLSQKLDVAIVTNQQGVGKGLMSQKDLDEIHEAINFEITKLGGRKLRIFACIHQVEDKCACRKPKPGLIFDAMARYKAFPYETIFIGEQDTDGWAAETAGIDFLKAENSAATINHLKGLLGGKKQKK